MPTPKNSDRKSTRLNSSHMSISYAVFCLNKKKTCRGNQPEQRLFTGAGTGLDNVEDLPGFVSMQLIDQATVNVQAVMVAALVTAQRSENAIGLLHENRVGTRRHTKPFFFNHAATSQIYTLSLHDALPI